MGSGIRLGFSGDPINADEIKQPFYDVRGVYDTADVIRELEEGADIFPIVFPVADSVRRVLLFYAFQLGKGCCLV